MQTFDQFIQEWKGNIPGYDGVPDNVGQCVQLFNYYNRDVVGAPDWWIDYAHELYTLFDENSPLYPYYEKIEYTSGSTPERRDVVVYSQKLPGTKGAGHVDMCTIPGVVIYEAFSCNWGGKQAHLVEHDFSYVLGWLRPKGVKKMQQEFAEKFVTYAYRGTKDIDPTNEQAGYWVARVREDPNKAWELLLALYESNEEMRKSPAKVVELGKALQKYQTMNGDTTKWETLKVLVRELIGK